MTIDPYLNARCHADQLTGEELDFVERVLTSPHRAAEHVLSEIFHRPQVQRLLELWGQGTRAKLRGGYERDGVENHSLDRNHSTYLH